MSLSDTVKRKTECKIISWHWAHSKELLTFSAFGIICLTFWHLATTQVKHSIESLDQGPGEKPPWCTSCTTKQQRWWWRRASDFASLATWMLGNQTHGIAGSCWARVAATVQERSDLSSADWHSSSTELWALCLPAEGPALWDVLKFSFDPE